MDKLYGAARRAGISMSIRQQNLVPVRSSAAAGTPPKSSTAGLATIKT